MNKKPPAGLSGGRTFAADQNGNAHPGRRRNGKRPSCLMAFFLAGFLSSLIFRLDAEAGDGIERAGDMLQLVLPVTGAGLALSRMDITGGMQLGTSVALTLGVTYALKFAVDAKRPNGGRHSFPSGHTSVSFCSAEFIRRRYGWILGMPAYAAAGFVGYSRIEAGQHYTRDVIAGAAIGMVSSRWLVRPYKGWHIRAETGGGRWAVRMDRMW